MGDIKNIIKNHSMQHYRTLKTIVEPLRSILDIPFFGYYRIEPEGRFVSLSVDPEPFDFYCSEEKFLTNPFLAHPRFFRPGFVFIQTDPNPSALEVFQTQFSMYFFIILIRRTGTHIEAFIYGNHNDDPLVTASLISKCDLLQKFATYFSREAKSIIAETLNGNYNLMEAKKEAFYHSDPSIPLEIQNPDASKFLESIAPLSMQESLCLQLFKEGHSSQSTAAILGISNRTVESYFENIKTKLECASKWDLLQW